MRVELTRAQTVHAKVATGQRVASAARVEAAGGRNRLGDDFRQGYERTLLESVGAEIAASIALGRAWTVSLIPDPAGDLGPGEQVRYTFRETNGLILRPRDRDWHHFVLVVGALPTYRVLGWLRAADGKRDEFWTRLRADWPPCWAVPAGRLLPLSAYRPPQVPRGQAA